MEDIPKENTGVLVGRRESDYLAGTLPYEIRLKSGDWRPYLPTEEHQYSDNVDTMACVSFSMNNALEIQHKFLTGSEINFSDRFLAKISGTTPQGNYLYKVADAVRKTGLVTEDIWPAPDHYTWATYYADIPQDVMDQAKKIDMNYEWLTPSKDELVKALKQAPVQIVIPEPYPNHAVVLVHIEGDTAFYFDTYAPYVKSIAISKINSALKPVLNSMNQVKIAVIHGEAGIFLAASDIPQLQQVGKIFGKDVQVGANNNVTNADIVV